MAWNTSLIAIEGDFTDPDVLRDQLGLPLGTPLANTSWFEATSVSAAGTAVGLVDDWTILCDPHAFLNLANPSPPEPGSVWSPELDAGLQAVSRSGCAAGFIISGVSDTYAWTLYRAGERVRCRLVQQGISLIDSGQAAPDELDVMAATSDEEQRVFELLARLGLTPAMLEEASFTLYAPDV